MNGVCICGCVRLVKEHMIEELLWGLKRLHEAIRMYGYEHECKDVETNINAWRMHVLNKMYETCL